MPFTAQKKIFNRLADLADIRCLSQEEQEKYDESCKVADDYFSGLYGYYIKGIEEGEARGEARGKSKERAVIALKMLATGMDYALIASLTGLTKEQIQNLGTN